MRDFKSFERILDGLEAPEEATRRDPGLEAAFANPLATATAPISANGADDPGVENLWDHAFAWAVDSRPAEASPEPRAAPPAVAPPADDAESIAAELGLADASTSDQLHRARRRFMWRNHPDRSPDVPTDLANRRAAIANRLIDLALSGLSQGAHSSR